MPADSSRPPNWPATPNWDRFREKMAPAQPAVPPAGRGTPHVAVPYDPRHPAAVVLFTEPFDARKQGIGKFVLISGSLAAGWRSSANPGQALSDAARKEMAKLERLLRAKFGKLAEDYHRRRRDAAASVDAERGNLPALEAELGRLRSEFDRVYARYKQELSKPKPNDAYMTALPKRMERMVASRKLLVGKKIPEEKQRLADSRAERLEGAEKRLRNEFLADAQKAVAAEYASMKSAMGTLLALREAGPEPVVFLKTREEQTPYYDAAATHAVRALRKAAAELGVVRDGRLAMNAEGLAVLEKYGLSQEFDAAGRRLPQASSFPGSGASERQVDEFYKKEGERLLDARQATRMDLARAEARQLARGTEAEKLARQIDSRQSVLSQFKGSALPPGVSSTALRGMRAEVTVLRARYLEVMGESFEVVDAARGQLRAIIAEQGKIAEEARQQDARVREATARLRVARKGVERAQQSHDAAMRELRMLAAKFARLPDKVRAWVVSNGQKPGAVASVNNEAWVRRQDERYRQTKGGAGLPREASLLLRDAARVTPRAEKLLNSAQEAKDHYRDLVDAAARNLERASSAARREKADPVELRKELDALARGGKGKPGLVVHTGEAAGGGDFTLLSGQYEGKKLREVPLSYIDWLARGAPYSREQTWRQVTIYEGSAAADANRAAAGKKVDLPLPVRVNRLLRQEDPKSFGGRNPFGEIVFRQVRAYRESAEYRSRARAEEYKEAEREVYTGLGSVVEMEELSRRKQQSLDPRLRGDLKKAQAALERDMASRAEAGKSQRGLVRYLFDRFTAAGYNPEEAARKASRAWKSPEYAGWEVPAAYHDDVYQERSPYGKKGERRSVADVSSEEGEHALYRDRLSKAKRELSGSGKDFGPGGYDPQNLVHRVKMQKALQSRGFDALDLASHDPDWVSTAREWYTFESASAAYHVAKVEEAVDKTSSKQTLDALGRYVSRLYPLGDLALADDDDAVRSFLEEVGDSTLAGQAEHISNTSRLMLQYLHDVINERTELLARSNMLVDDPAKGPDINLGSLLSAYSSDFGMPVQVLTEGGDLAAEGPDGGLTETSGHAETFLEARMGRRMGARGEYEEGPEDSPFDTTSLERQIEEPIPFTGMDPSSVNTGKTRAAEVGPETPFYSEGYGRPLAAHEGEVEEYRGRGRQFAPPPKEVDFFKD